MVDFNGFFIRLARWSTITDPLYAIIHDGFGDYKVLFLTIHISSSLAKFYVFGGVVIDVLTLCPAIGEPAMEHRCVIKNILVWQDICFGVKCESVPQAADSSSWVYMFLSVTTAQVMFGHESRQFYLTIDHWSTVRCTTLIDGLANIRVVYHCIDLTLIMLSLSEMLKFSLYVSHERHHWPVIVGKRS